MDKGISKPSGLDRIDCDHVFDLPDDVRLSLRQLLLELYDYDQYCDAVEAVSEYFGFDVSDCVE